MDPRRKGITTMTIDTRPQTHRGGQGFAAMSPERRREVARKGAASAHAKGVAHKWSKDEALYWSKIGGEKRHMNAKQQGERELPQ